MADHLRTQIRDRVIELLRGLDTTEDRVFRSRMYPLDEPDLPGICVYTLTEDSEIMNMGPTRHLQRQIDIAVEAVVQVTETLDDELDQICAEIEAAMGADPTLAGLAYDCILTRTAIGLQPVKGTERPTGSAVMTYRAIYRSRASDATTTN